MGFPIPRDMPFDQKLLRELQFRNMFSPERMNERTVGVDDRVPLREMPPIREQTPMIRGQAPMQPQLKDPLLETPQADAYYKAVSEPQPVRQKSSIWRNIASLASRDPEAFRQAPYRHRVEERENKLGELEKAATIEKGYRGQNIVDAKNYNAAVINSIKAGTQQSDVASRIDDRGRRTRLAEATLEFAKYKLDHPDWELKAVPGGKYTWFNPQTRQVEETKYDSGDLPELEEIDRRGGWNVKAAQARGAVTQAVQSAGDYRPFVGSDGKMYRYNPTTNQLEPAGGDTTFPVPGSGKSDDKMTPNEVEQDKINKAAEFIRNNPDLEDWFKIQDGIVSVSSPNTKWWSDNSKDAEIRARINKALGDTQPGVVSTATTTVAPGKAAPPPRAETNARVPGQAVQVKDGDPSTLPPPQDRQEGLLWVTPNGKKVKWNKAGMGWEDR